MPCPFRILFATSSASSTATSGSALSSLAALIAAAIAAASTSFIRRNSRRFFLFAAGISPPTHADGRARLCLADGSEPHVRVLERLLNQRFRACIGKRHGLLRRVHVVDRYLSGVLDLDFDVVERHYAASAFWK